MQKIEIKVTPDQIENEEVIQQLLRKKAKSNEIPNYQLDRRSIDARQKQIYYRLRYLVDSEPIDLSYAFDYKNVQNAEEVIIIGAGPAGYFAALKLISLGCKPIVLDRGKDVRSRRKDLRAIQQEGIVNPHSNYCFGEGGAGTYSDGKLYTRSHKRGNIEEVLHIFHEHGAPDDILVDAHPHIGSNKLPKIVSTMRETIEHFGGEIHFNAYVKDFTLEGNEIRSVELESGESLQAKLVILATGHSARDIFYLLDNKNIAIEPKDYAIGVRIEHPQSLIDKMMYNQFPRHENLPASSYRVACEINSKGVFSFCMCPGGLIVPASTAPGELVVNGMSLSKRNSPFANSGFVTAVDQNDYQEYGYSGVFAGLNFQKHLEKDFFNAGDGTQSAPAQNVIDFLDGNTGKSLHETSYIPGIYQAEIHKLLPNKIVHRMREALTQFNRKMPDYVTDEAQLIGLESRTSSPIRIPRSRETLTHPQIVNLYPCGEGAGYAGGILSAAMDGQKIAKQIASVVFNKN